MVGLGRLNMLYLYFNFIMFKDTEAFCSADIALALEITDLLSNFELRISIAIIIRMINILKLLSLQ